MQYSPLTFQELKENSWWYLILGIGLVAVGALAIFYSTTATIISVLALGALLVTSGLFEGFKSFKISRWSNFFLHLFLAIVYIIGGGFIILNPGLSALNLTLLLSIFFVISGVTKVIFGASQPVLYKGWLIANGIVTFILGLLIWNQWPASGLWVIGTFIGIDMIFTGITWIMIGTTARDLHLPTMATTPDRTPDRR